MALDMHGVAFARPFLSDLPELKQCVRVSTSDLISTKVVAHGDLLFSRDRALVVNNGADGAVRRNGCAHTLSAADWKEELGKSSTAFCAEGAHRAAGCRPATFNHRAIVVSNDEAKGSQVVVDICPAITGKMQRASGFNENMNVRAIREKCEMFEELSFPQRAVEEPVFERCVVD